MQSERLNLDTETFYAREIDDPFMISEYSNFGKLDKNNFSKLNKPKQTRSVEVLKRHGKSKKQDKHLKNAANQFSSSRGSCIKLKPVQPKMRKKINKQAVLGVLQSMNYLKPEMSQYERISNCFSPERHRSSNLDNVIQSVTYNSGCMTERKGSNMDNVYYSCGVSSPAPQVSSKYELIRPPLVDTQTIIQREIMSGGDPQHHSDLQLMQNIDFKSPSMKSQKFLNKIMEGNNDGYNPNLVKSVSRISTIDTNKIESPGEPEDLNTRIKPKNINFLDNSHKRTKHKQGRYFRDERISLPQISQANNVSQKVPFSIKRTSCAKNDDMSYSTFGKETARNQDENAENTKITRHKSTSKISSKTRNSKILSKFFSENRSQLRVSNKKLNTFRRATNAQRIMSDRTLDFASLNEPILEKNIEEVESKKHDRNPVHVENQRYEVPKTPSFANVLN